MGRSGSRRWRLGRLTLGFSWDVDGLTLPRFYRWRDQPECFGFYLAPRSCDHFFSIDFTWEWRALGENTADTGGQHGEE